jgi:hypothetical protein
MDTCDWRMLTCLNLRVHIRRQRCDISVFCDLSQCHMTNVQVPPGLYTS